VFCLQAFLSVQQLIEASATQQIMTVVPDFPPNFVPDSRKVTIAVTGLCNVFLSILQLQG
jgi:hypothetical protein